MGKGLERLIFATGMVSGLLFLAGGCSLCRTSHGWTLRPRYTLEYSEPFRLSLAQCSAPKNCNPDGAAAIPGNAEYCGENIPSASVGKKFGDGENSVWLRLLQRRGRLGVCANCRKMMRMEASAPPPMAGQAPVNAKFNPVPTEPVFAARALDIVPGNLKSVPNRQNPLRSPLPLQPFSPSSPPEEISTPPAILKDGKPVDSAGPLETSSEHHSWVFSKPLERNPDPVIEIPSPSMTGSPLPIRKSSGTHAAQSSTRR